MDSLRTLLGKDFSDGRRSAVIQLVVRYTLLAGYTLDGWKAELEVVDAGKKARGRIGCPASIVAVAVAGLAVLLCPLFVGY